MDLNCGDMRIARKKGKVMPRVDCPCLHCDPWGDITLLAEVMILIGETQGLDHFEALDQILAERPRNPHCRIRDEVVAE